MTLLFRCFARHHRTQRSTTRRTTRALATKPYYITTPIFYPNAVPHIGHLYCLVVADIFARYQRILNPARHLEFLAGTDEHGLKIQKAAQAKGLPPSEFCDLISSQFRRLGGKAQLSNTMFMRTTELAHHQAVESVWRQLDAKNLIYKGNYSGWYSITDECFYTPAQVTTTTSPAASITIATETSSPVEWQSEQNYMFRLSNFQSSLLEHYTNPTNSGTIFPPQHHAHIVQILSSGPLDDLSISRPRSRLEWGVPVPDDPGHTIYVWFDALLVYLAGIGYPWKADPLGRRAEAWPVDLQVIGKDILRFHAIYLPAILQALDLPLQRRLLTHAHWTVEQKKMSKSVGNVVDPFETMQEFGVDVVRFYFARVGGRFRDDVDWSQDQVEKHQKEIQSLLGNFFLRITSQTIQMRMAGVPHLSLGEIYADQTFSIAPIRALIHATRELPDKVKTCMDALEMADALSAVMELLRIANKTITDLAPWKKTSAPSDVYACYVSSLEVLRVVGICLQPFVPETADKLLNGLGVPVERRSWAELERKGEEEVWSGGKAVSGVKLF